MDKEILTLILDKLENIEKEQKETKREIQGINTILDRLEDGQEVIKKDIKEIKSIQNTIQEFMLSTEKAIEIYEQDHRFIEKLKKVAGE